MQFHNKNFAGIFDKEKRSQKINDPRHELHHLFVMMAYPQNYQKEVFKTDESQTGQQVQARSRKYKPKPEKSFEVQTSPKKS